jgi:hypothetical protein
MKLPVVILICAAFVAYGELSWSNQTPSKPYEYVRCVQLINSTGFCLDWATNPVED